MYPLPISTHPKLPAQSVKVILSGASSLSSSLPPPLIPFYVFLRRLDRLAPPAGKRLEWRCIPNQIRGEMVASGSTKGVKIGKSLGLIRQISGAGAGITPCWSGGSGRCSWTGSQLRRRRSGSNLLHNKLLREREDNLSALSDIKDSKYITLEKTTSAIHTLSPQSG